MEFRGIKVGKVKLVNKVIRVDRAGRD
jgi:hypothetical protein